MPHTKLFVIFDELVDIFLRHVLAHLHGLRCDATDVSLLLVLRITLVGLSLTRRRHDRRIERRYALLTTIIACVQAIMHALSIVRRLDDTYFRRGYRIWQRTSIFVPQLSTL